MKYLIAILIMLVCTACVYAVDYLPDEVVWLDDPNEYATLFDEWDTDGWHAEYVMVVIENWGRTGRVPLLTVDGKAVTNLPYSWLGDLDHSGTVNMRDFAKAAKQYRGRIVCRQRNEAQRTSDIVTVTKIPTQLQMVYSLLLLSDTSGGMD